ncbi:SusD-like starch-binding protein associating with outer membrane [Larkinella arboricola]|uniref:SusD-like starch-binding protein associating with outer membrane n=1 Tax=Larkinella arboricola TaxID=643671 RepID=A0A327WKH7_LARAB|nr:RagB/SusD family nutrient uptake outer membrane protein [Larkinella arboricola]RAJ91117.1 SusD-like starch-binding protein associating with outer membrane [Larkinella arboricola]
METKILLRNTLLALLIALSACKNELQPYDSKSNDVALATPADIQIATFGNYAMLVAEPYTRHFLTLNEWPGDNVVQSGADGDQASLAASYLHIPAMYPTQDFWAQSYKLIYATNLIIDKITDGESAALDQLKGENLFLRALAHFNLVRLFGRPYAQNKGQNPGIPVITRVKAEEFPTRHTVKEVYDQVIKDLLQAAVLMKEAKNANFASKEVAEALLSRVYLYLEDNANAILYANKVIDSKRYQLASIDTYKKAPTLVPETNPETIFNFRHTLADNKDKNAVGSLYYNDPVTLSTGWGEYYASQTFMDLLNEHPEDARLSFITPHYINGKIQYRGTSPIYFINKFNWQEGIANLSSPVYLRLAEMYLNRAEAYAKTGQNQLAINDVNTIRTRAGLAGKALYTLNDLKGRGSVLNVVLEERRLELAFEGHRPGDLYRNNLPLVRAYPGLHGTDNFHFRVEPTHPRVIFYIPEREVNINKNLVQNP